MSVLKKQMFCKNILSQISPHLGNFPKEWTMYQLSGRLAGAHCHHWEVCKYKNCTLAVGGKLFFHCFSIILKIFPSSKKHSPKHKWIFSCSSSSPHPSTLLPPPQSSSPPPPPPSSPADFSIPTFVSQWNEIQAASCVICPSSESQMTGCRLQFRERHTDKSIAPVMALTWHKPAHEHLKVSIMESDFSAQRVSKDKWIS